MMFNTNKYCTFNRVKRIERGLIKIDKSERLKNNGTFKNFRHKYGSIKHYMCNAYRNPLK